MAKKHVNAGLALPISRETRAKLLNLKERIARRRGSHFSEKQGLGKKHEAIPEI